MSVLGSNFLMTKQLDVWMFLPAISIGLLSSAVLNLNNMRDELSDRNSKKMTLVVKGGKKFAKPYHFSLILLAFICMVIFLNLDTYSSYNWILLPLTAFIPLAIHLRKIYHYTDPKTLDPELKKVALSTFALGFILFWIVFLEF